MARLLVLSSRWPLPAASGEKKRTMAVLKELSSLTEVTLVSLSEQPISSDDLAKMKQLTGCAEIVVIPHGFGAKVKGLLTALFSSRPLQAGYFESPSMNQWVLRNSGRFDGVYALLARTAEAALLCPAPKILDLCDLISVNYSSAASRKSGLMKLAYRFEGARMRRFEEKMSRFFDKTLLVNPAEVDTCRRRGLDRTDHLALGIGEPQVSKDDVMAVAGRIGFLGKMDYAPNVDAVQWFCREVLPLLPPTYHFRIIGSSPSPAVRRLASDRVFVTGFVQDVAPEIRSCEWMVAPLRFGAGVQNKILEAWLAGRPVLMAPEVALGLGCDPETVSPFLARNAEEYREKIVSDDGGEEMESLLSRLKGQALSCHGIARQHQQLRGVFVKLGILH